MKHESDLFLARNLLKGDAREFDRFFADYFPRLYRFAMTRMDTDESAAQDVVQTTLMNAVRSMDSYRGEASMFTWLCQICRNEINAHFRRLQRSVPVVAQDDDAIRPILESLEAESRDNPESAFQGSEITQLIQDVLDYLPANYGNALEWKYIEGFSVTEIAARLEVTELAAQSLLSRARNAFRDAILKLSPQLAMRGE
ncbi:MAG: RNA polymerase sigma factor [Pseudomonadota bacterium]